MPRYYIAVPDNKKWSYQTIFTWKNYSFYGTYHEAIVKAIELFSEEGYFEDYKDKIYDFYGTDVAYKMHDAYDAWADEDYESMWNNTSSFFEDYFQFESDDYNKGIIEWDNFDNECMKNWDEDEVCVVELN